MCKYNLFDSLNSMDNLELRLSLTNLAGGAWSCPRRRRCPPVILPTRTTLTRCGNPCQLPTRIRGMAPRSCTRSCRHRDRVGGIPRPGSHLRECEPGKNAWWWMTTGESTSM